MRKCEQLRVELPSSNRSCMVVRWHRFDKKCAVQTLCAVPLSDNYLGSCLVCFESRTSRQAVCLPVVWFCLRPKAWTERGTTTWEDQSSFFRRLQPATRA